MLRARFDVRRREESAIPKVHPSASAALFALFCGATSSGCVHTYQPLAGLHTPIVVDPTAPNFTDVRLRTQCEKGDLLYYENSNLCRKIGALFENQGAEVTEAGGGSFSTDAVAAEEGEESEVEEPTDLQLTVRSRQVYKNNSSLSWFIALSTATVLPIVEEEVFALDIEVRDGTGFLLARETFEGRIVSRYGIGPWVGNKIADFAWRNEDEQFTGDVAGEELSADIYGQLSQIVFNAKLQWQLLQMNTADAGPR